MHSLDNLGLKYATDKASYYHDLLRFYERRFAHFKDADIVIFEIGVGSGGSLKMLSEYFPAAKIVGLDTDPSCALADADSIKVCIGDASSVSFIGEIINNFGKPNIVIDDGSHRWDHQIASFQILFPQLAPGGVYVIEAMDTSFEGHLKSAPFDGYSKISTFDYLNKLSRPLVADAALGAEKPYDLFVASNSRWVSSIELARRVVMISKKLNPEDGPW